MKKWIVWLAAGLLLFAGSANAIVLTADVRMNQMNPQASYTMQLFDHDSVGPHPVFASGTGSGVFEFDVRVNQWQPEWEFVVRTARGSLQPLRGTAVLTLDEDWMRFQNLQQRYELGVPGSTTFALIPEPQTWLALAVGLALVGGFYARRTQRRLSRSRVHAVPHKE